MIGRNNEVEKLSAKIGLLEEEIQRLKLTHHDRISILTQDLSSRSDQLSNNRAELKKTKELLERSERRLVFALNATPVGHWVYECESGQWWHSEQWYSLLGFSESDFAKDKDPFLELINLESLQKIEGPLERFRSGDVKTPIPMGGGWSMSEEVYSTKYLMATKVPSTQNKNHTLVPVAAQGRLFRSDKGTYFAGGYRTITKEAHEHQLYQAMLDTFPGFVFAKNSAHQLIYANKALADAFGLTKNSILHKTDEDLSKIALENIKNLHPEYSEDRFTEYSRIFEKQNSDFKGDDKEVFEKGSKKTRTETCLTAHLQMIKLSTIKNYFKKNDNQGSSTDCIVGVSVDISSLDEKLVQLETLINNITDGVFVKDDQLKFVLANDAMARYLLQDQSATSPDIIGKSDEDFKEIFSQVDEMMREERRLLNTMDPIMNKIVRVPAPDASGKLMTRAVNKIPFESGDKTNPKALIFGVSRDVSDIINLRDSLLSRENDLLHAQWQTWATHNIDEPLVNLATGLSSLSSEPDQQTGDSSFISTLKDEAQKALNTVKEFRSEFSGGKTHSVLTTPRKLLHTLKVSKAILLEEKSISVEMEWAPVTEILVPRLPLMMALECVFSNAIDELANSEPPRKIILRSKLVENQRNLILEIQDNGGGMKEEKIREINANEKERTRSTKAGGLGFGLKICKSIIREKLKGHVEWANSDGGGTNVEIKIPYKENPK